VNQFHLLGQASCGERESIFLLKFCEESMAAESSGGGSLLLHRTLLFFFLFNKCKFVFVICQWENEIMGGGRGCDR